MFLELYKSEKKILLLEVTKIIFFHKKSQSILLHSYPAGQHS